MKIREHLVAFWIEKGNSFIWYLCVIDNIENDGLYTVSHLTRNDKCGSNWLFPEELNSYKILNDQILCKNISVTYHHSTRMRCTIDNIGKQNQ